MKKKALFILFFFTLSFFSSIEGVGKDGGLNKMDNTSIVTMTDPQVFSCFWWFDWGTDFSPESVWFIDCQNCTWRKAENPRYQFTCTWPPF